MTDYGHELQFGTFITPLADQANEVLELAKLTELVGLDLVTFHDHPYQASFMDTWTLLSFIAAQTSNVRVAPNVLNLPLRPPVVLARSVASLDILSGGRVELGLGSGAFLDRLEEEHHVIAEVLDQVDRALVAVVSEPDGMTRLRQAIDLLTDTMLSHLSYEQRELIEPLARLG